MINYKYKILANTRIGHIHLKVSDLNRSLDFYTNILGSELVTMYGNQSAFVSAVGYHHHIGLNTWQSLGTPISGKHSVGLYHAAILYPTRKDLAVILNRFIKLSYPITGAADNGVSEAIYLDDPDGNGLELYYDKPKEDWPQKEDSSIEMYTNQLE